jgi:hypothetical protein
MIVLGKNFKCCFAPTGCTQIILSQKSANVGG